MLWLPAALSAPSCTGTRQATHSSLHSKATEHTADSLALRQAMSVLEAWRQATLEVEHDTLVLTTVADSLTPYGLPLLVVEARRSRSRLRAQAGQQSSGTVQQATLQRQGAQEQLRDSTQATRATAQRTSATGHVAALCAALLLALAIGAVLRRT